MKKPIPFGKYYLLERISVGGMAEVFKAKAFGVEGFERLIAVKRILPSIAEDHEFITMFIDEAKIAVQLNHANIAQIFDLGKVGDSYFIALEYVPGKDLRAIFDKMRKLKELIPIPMACYTIMKVCEGLDYAHNKKDAAGRDLNLVHRDVSPQNVLISYDGEIKIIDFGIAKAAGKAGKTQAGILKGKFGYMSPEQVRGLPLDRRSDIFSVGICLYELLTGERLFIGESDFSTLEKVRNVEIIPPSTYNRRIPEELERIVLKALAKEVEDRYQTAMDLHDDLQTFMYTSGNFFARKDLATFVAKMFTSDIEKEQASNEIAIGKARSTSPPPPGRVSAPPPAGRRVTAPPPPPSAKPAKLTKPRLSAVRKAGAPPPSASGPDVRAGSAPPPPPRPAAKSIAGRKASTVPPPPPGRSTSDAGRVSVPSRPLPERASAAGKAPVPGAGPPRPARTTAPTGVPAVRAGAPAQTPKRTMLGLPSPMAGPGSHMDDEALPPDLASGKVATPIAAPGGQDAGLSMDWDDDEPPTHVYDRQQAPSSTPSTGSGPSLAQIQRPSQPVTASPGDVAPVSEVSRVSKEKKGFDKRLAAVLVVTAVIAAVIVYFIIKPPPAGTAVVSVDPEDAVVRIDDKEAKPLEGSSPFVIQHLSEGVHTLFLSKEGYLGKKLVLDISAGSTAKTEAVLEKVGSNTGFALETDPPGAELFIDNRPYGEKTPVTVTGIKPGTYQLRIVKGDQFEALAIEVQIKDGEILKIPPKKLSLREVEVVLQSQPSGADIVLIDKTDRKRISLGKTPVTKRLDAKNEYEVEYKLDGYERLLKALNFSENKERITVAVELAQVEKKSPRRSTSRKTPRKSSTSKTAVPKPASGGQGFLSVQTRPWTKVYIDGRFIRNTPLVRHQLPAGSHTVVCENPDFNITKKYRVTIRAGQTTTLVRSLVQ